MTIYFSSIGKKISLEATIDEMPGRDKVNLLTELLRDLGITKRLLDMQAGQTVIAIIDEQCKKHWGIPK